MLFCQYLVFVNSCSDARMCGYELASNWYRYCVTQQPFELKLTMPPTDRGGRGYSDEYVAELTKELLEYKR